MINKWDRRRFMIAAASFLLCIVGVIIVVLFTIHDLRFAQRFGVAIPLAIAATVVLLIITRKIFPERMKSEVLFDWIVFVREMPWTFPVTEAERKRLVSHAEKRLMELAGIAHKARTKTDVAMQTWQSACLGVDPRDPFELRVSRRELRNLFVAYEEAKYDWKKADGKYQRVWRILTERNPYGAGILTEYAGRHRDPDRYLQMTAYELLKSIG